MNKLANARNDAAFAKTKRTEQVRLAKESSVVSHFLAEVYLLKPQGDCFLRENQSFRPQFSVPLQNFMEAQRNIPLCHFVYTGAAPYRAAQGEIQKKPRGGSRGVMTRSFSGR